MFECRICKTPTSESDEICPSPKCLDAFEDAKIEATWRKIQLDERAEELHLFEEHTYGPLYLTRQQLLAEELIFTVGADYFSREIPHQPTSLMEAASKDTLDQTAQQILQAKIKEDQEWRDSQKEANATIAQVGSERLTQIRQQIEVLDAELREIEQTHDLMSHEKCSLEEQLEKLRAITGERS